MVIRDYVSTVCIENDDTLDREVIRWDMKSLIEYLPQVQREIVIKRYWKGLNSTQIGQETEQPPSTVRYHLREAMKTLRQIYKGEVKRDENR